MIRVAVLVLALAACHRGHRAAELVVPVTHDTFELDGELHEPDWNRIGDPKTFTTNGAEAHPYSQVRLLHDATNLYIGLYAADQDIRTTDKFEVTIGALAFAVNPLGQITPAIPGVRAGHDTDGTLDHAEDEDEEWVLEVVVPRERIGSATAPFHVRRCDTPKDGVVRCGTWDAQILLRDPE